MKTEDARRAAAEVSRHGRQAQMPRRRRAPALANPIADLRREFAEQGFQRIGGGRVVPGNRLRVLRDARENYPAWIAAIESARRTIHLEMYIVHDDATGRRFRDLLVARARAGVKEQASTMLRLGAHVRT